MSRHQQHQHEAIFRYAPVPWKDRKSMCGNGKECQRHIPSLVLGAAHDRIFILREVQSFARTYVTTAEIFPDTAHDMMLEAAWQQVAERINVWLGDVLAGK